MSRAVVTAALGCLVGLPSPASAQVRPDRLLVATRETPPFAMRQTDGSWEGVSIALWRAVADQLDVTWEFVELELGDMLDSVAAGSVDAAAAAVTITADREARLDFSHPFYATGLAIAVPRQGHLVGRVAAALVSPLFLTVTASLALLLGAIGLLIWLAERRRNPEQFGGGAVRGIGAGFWWAAVTMTTVGYGDKAPRTPWGRVLALVWMFASIVTISGFTAGIATALTVEQFSSNIRRPLDLAGQHVGTVTGSTSDTYLDERGLRATGFATIDEALTALAGGGLDAVVYDAPILAYAIRQHHPTALALVPGTFERQDYAVALPPGSPLREPLNRALLSVLESRPWRGVLERYFGQ